MKMYLKTRLMLVSAGIIFLSILLITVFVLVTVNRNADREIEAFQTREKADIKSELRERVDKALDTMATSYEMLADPESLKKIVAQMSYNDGRGYFWITDTAEPYPEMVMHPKQPDLEGKILDDPAYGRVSKKNENIFVASVQAAETSGSGFIEYEWPKPLKDGKIGSPQPKLAYVRLFEPLNWVVGTGIYVDELRQSVEEKKAAKNAMISQTLFKIGIIALGVLVLACIVIFKISGAMLKPLSELSRFANDIGKGNLDATIEYARDDEIGTTAVAMTDMAERLRRLIADLLEKIETISKASEGLNKISGHLKKSSGQMKSLSEKATQRTGSTTENIKNIASSAEDISGQVDSVSGYSDEVSRGIKGMGEEIANVSQAVNTVAAAIDEMYASFNEVAKNSGRGAAVAEEAAEKAGNTSTIVNDLGESAGEIGHIIDLIKGIADQTNLLALNAAIEAAGAGDAGKGFAVVAKEVKELARQTAQASEDIRNRIEKMQHNTESAVKAIASISSVIKDINDIMTTIASAVEQQTATTNEIAQNINSTAEGADDLTRNADKIVQSVMKVADDIDRLDREVKKISENTGQASVGTEDVLESVNGVNGSIKNSARAISSVSQHAKSLAELSEALSETASHFKV